MGDTTALSNNSPECHPILQTLRTDLCALEVEAIKLSERQLGRNSR